MEQTNGASSPAKAPFAAGTDGSPLAEEPWKVLSPLMWVELARANLTGFGKVLHVILTIILFATVVEALLRLYRIFRRYPVW